MTTHMAKTWFEDGKLITQLFEEKDIYKREWVGLTDMDIASVANNNHPLDGVKNFARAIEAKLKELNT